jgi:hypothetical protein
MAAKARRASRVKSVCLRKAASGGVLAAEFLEEDIGKKRKFSLSQRMKTRLEFKDLPVGHKHLWKVVESPGKRLLGIVKIS